MLKTVSETSAMIEEGKWLHISGAEVLLRQLPKGNWIGGSLEYFIGEDGGITTNEKLFVDEMPFDSIKICVYNDKTVKNVLLDAYDNGFSIIILPFGSSVRDEYARNAPSYPDMFLKAIVGWGSGYNLDNVTQPIVVNGQTGEFFTDEAVVMHVSLPEDRIANVGIINMFTPNEDGPLIEFLDDSATIEKCLIDGKEVIFADYLTENNIDIKAPVVGAFYNANINATIFSIDNDKKTTTFASVVYKDIKYRFGNPVPDYFAAFNAALADFQHLKPIFFCNCLYSYLYGEIEGKKIGNFRGLNVYGEVAYQYVNQTMVYLTIE